MYIWKQNNCGLWRAYVNLSTDINKHLTKSLRENMEKKLTCYEGGMNQNYYKQKLMGSD